MPNISQKINTYIHGISQQPDHLMRPGQVRDLVNGFPDITFGLLKKPGSDLVSNLATTEFGKWFTIFRDANEKYIGQILNGTVKIWSLIDGLPRVVRYNSTPNLEKPEDGGVGIPPGFDEEPSTPGSGGSNPLPGTCNLTALNQALDAYIAAQADEANKRVAYNNALSTYNLYRSDPYREEYRSPQRNGTTLTLGHAVRAFSHDYLGSVNLPGNHIRMAEDRNEMHSAIDWGNDVADGRGFYVGVGTYSSGQISAAESAYLQAQAALQLAEAVTQTRKRLYNDEAVKCNITPKVNASPVVPYLEAGNPAMDLDTLTLNDYTFIVNRKKIVSMGGDKSGIRPYEAFVEIKALEYNTEYSLTIAKPGAGQNVPKTYAKTLSVSPAGGWTDGDGSCPFTDAQTFDYSSGTKINMRYQLETRGSPIPNGQYDYDCRYDTYVTLINGGENWVTGDTWTVNMKGRDYTIRVASHDIKWTYDTIVNIPPYLAPKDQATGVLTPSAVLNHFKTNIENTSGWSCRIVGNGLYIKGPQQFSLYTSGGRSDSAIAGMTDKVNNISKLPLQCVDGYVVKILNTGEHEDDYYVKFVGTEPGVDGAGAWEETVAPGITVNLNYVTMPHQIVRMPDGSFMVSPVDWDNREVGDKKTNPAPSFVGKTINKMFFYRNRLGMLSDENVILSRAGDYFNFFGKTAITVSDSDPIDLAASSTTPSVLHDAVPMNPGLVLFSRDRQFILTTANDVLTPIAVKLEVLSTFHCTHELRAVDMGTTIGFMSDAGKYSRMWEMTGVNSNTTPEVLEQSKIVQELLPSGITDIADAKENTLLLLGKRTDTTVYGYRYFNDGNKRVQSSWFKWTLPGGLVHHAIDNDIYYSVVKVGNDVLLAKTDLIQRATDFTVLSSVSYRPKLELMKTVPSGSITYNPSTRESSFLVGHNYVDDAVVFGTGNERFQGVVMPALSVVPEAGQWRVTVQGDWSKTDAVIGYNYEFKVDMPNSYYLKEEQERSISETRMYTNIHRIKLQFSKVGIFDVAVNRKGKQDTHYQYEMSPADDYDADTHEVMPVAFMAVPVYEKNTNVNLTLTSTNPTPCSLLSSVWEGHISPKSYKSV